MTPPPIILADDFDGWGKLLVGVIFAVIWGIGALSSVIKKANEQAKRNAAMKPKAPAVPAAGAQYFRPPAARAAAPRANSAAQQQLAQQQARQRAAAIAQQQRTAQAKAPPPIPPARPVAASPTSPKPAMAGAGVATKSAGGANAAAIRRWLQPGTIRRQFILTELFQPALALREPRKPT